MLILIDGSDSAPNRSTTVHAFREKALQVGMMVRVGGQSVKTARARGFDLAPGKDRQLHPAAYFFGLASGTPLAKYFRNESSDRRV
jgi:hypothetical protein